MKSVNLIPFIQAAYADWPAAKNHLRQELLDGGWSNFFSKLVDPLIGWQAAQGLRPRAMIWLPYGQTEKTGDYSLDSYYECKAKKLPNTNLSAFQAELTRRVAGGAEIIIYIGAPTSVPNLSAGAFFTRLNEPVMPLLNAGASIAVDASALIFSGTWQAAWIENIRQALLTTNPLIDRLYIEARPYTTTWTANAGVICMDEQWQAQGTWPNALPDSQILGEVLRWPQQPNWVDPTNAGWGGTDDQVSIRIIADVNRINGEGHSAIVALEPLIRSGKTIKDFAA